MNVWIRRGGGIVACLLLVWSLLPLVNGITHFGVWFPALVSAGAVVWGFWPGSGKPREKGGRRMEIALMAAVAAVAVLAAVLTGLMASAVSRKPTAGETVVVLGAKINGDSPSRMLRDRLNVAAAYLKEHPEANCVVTGGLGKGEAYTEAWVMARYLTEEQGIAPERIALEDRSTSTEENLAFAMEIIRERDWSPRLAIATQEFHQYRAGVFAHRAGAESVSAVTCASPWHLLLCYWVRECAALCRLGVLGY